MEDHEQSALSPGSRDTATRCTLAAAESYVARSPGSGEPGDASGAGFGPSFAALLDWADACGLIRPAADFLILATPPDGYGDEHQAWFDEASSRWFKATYENRFVLAWGRDGSATPKEYLSRLILQNRYFADDIRIEAIVESNGKLRVLTSQPHIAGEPAPYQRIQDWFLEHGFQRLEIGERIAWYRLDENLLVADAHEGNIILAEGGELIPIDLNIILPSGMLKEMVLAAAGVAHP